MKCYITANYNGSLTPQEYRVLFGDTKKELRTEDDVYEFVRIQKETGRKPSMISVFFRFDNPVSFEQLEEARQRTSKMEAELTTRIRTGRFG